MQQEELDQWFGNADDPAMYQDPGGRAFENIDDHGGCMKLIEVFAAANRTVHLTHVQ